MLRSPHYTVFVLIVMLIVIGLLVEPEIGHYLRDWAWMWVSGWLTLVVALKISFGLPNLVHETLTRLSTRGVLAAEGDGLIGADDLKVFEEQLHRAARRSTLVWGVPVTTAAIVVAWLVALRGVPLTGYALFMVVEALGAVVAAPFVGRAISYGRLSTRIADADFRLRAEPDHFDGVGGLRPIGQLYWFQAAVLAVPAAFLAVWWYLIPLFGSRYAVWRNPYAGLLALVVGLEVLAFILPMLSFHRIMCQWKRDFQRDADTLSREAAQLRVALLTATGEHRTALEEEISAKDARFKAIEVMPTWPVDVRLRRRFTIKNVLLLLPVVGQVLGLSEVWLKLIENLQKAAVP